jgi:hypothetical protein
MAGRSGRSIKTFEELLNPFKIAFPITIEGSVNKDRFIFKKGEEVILTKSQYEVLAHSDYARYLGH